MRSSIRGTLLRWYCGQKYDFIIKLCCTTDAQEKQSYQLAPFSHWEKKNESADSSNQSKLLLVLRYCEGVQPKEVYFGISTLPKADAKTIFDKAWNALESEGFVLNKLILVLGDNAPTI